jgi:anti-sigma regulatory factor (Ser/Thr protein kinase)
MPAVPSALNAAVDLPSVPRSVPVARCVVTQLLTAWAAEGYRDDAALLISELVTNVVRHVAGEAAMTVEVHLTRAALHVAVVDGSIAPAATRPRTADGGYGLWLVAAVADRWGSEEHARGKRVWFELRRAA